MSITASVEDLDGVAVLQSSAVYFNDSLKQYRLCHDLGLASGLMQSSAVAKLDECAVSFRKLSCFGTALAEKVAAVWCGTSGMFYRNLAKLNGKDPSKILKTIAGNAEDLSKGFKYLADSSDKLAVNFKSFGVEEPSVQDVFLRAFEEEENQAVQMEAEKKQELEEIKAKSAAAKEEIRASVKKTWYHSVQKVGAAALNRLVNLGDGEEVTRKLEELESTKKLEEKMEMELKEAQKKLKEQTDLRKKAQVLAVELAKLMKMLREVSAICRIVGEYFNEQAEKFRSYSGVKMGEDPIPKGLTEKEAMEEAEKLAKQRVLLEKYHKSMTVINASYNFTPVGSHGNDRLSTGTMLGAINLDVLGISVPN